MIRLKTPQLPSLFCSVDDIFRGEKCEFLRNQAPTPALDPSFCFSLEGNHGRAAMERRVNVATGWASTRIAVLDKEDRYEDSYAVTQEFREWITCLGENNAMLEDNVHAVPRNPEQARIAWRQLVKRQSAGNLKNSLNSKALSADFFFGLIGLPPSAIDAPAVDLTHSHSALENVRRIRAH